jgi:CRISPR-associated endonuclease/helicase Cas3
MNYKYYAKSNPIETIREHTDKLLENLEILKRTYGAKIVQVIDMPEDRFWQLMEIICKYHDVGKVYSGFQNEIRKNIGEPLLHTKFNNEQIKHEQISPMFVPYKEYELTKIERKLVYQTIYYHHERNNTIHIDGDLLKEIIEEDIKPNIPQIENELQIKVPELKTTYLGMVEGHARITEFDDTYKDYCMMKGLLHRLDHCSSAWIPVEDGTRDEISKFVEEFMKKQNFEPNDLQQFAKANQNKNVIVIGSTGMGKTEGALLWSNNDKTFFTLPLRISINAIYDRIKETIGYEHVGLLHSTAIDYLDDKNEENEFEKIDQARNLYEKITTCTIDQIFPFVFKYRGYEKIYATLSYSKVVIDEIQAYSPEIVAVILKGLQMINKLNGKFMVMTATLPRIYKEKLEEMEIKFEYNEFIKDTIRHKIQLVDSGIEEDLEEIKENSKNKKVLIIVNTINKAIEIYQKLKNKDVQNVNLLHSRFIQSDRSEKEEKIKEFSKNRDEVGIWITTQIVEASLDIDFDMLYTEMSTLDSLFQRLGRCYRSREYCENLPNVKIYTKGTNGVGYIYDDEIYEKSIELLRIYNGEILQEKVKIDLVDKLYSKEMLQGTEFYKKFKKAFKILDNIIDYDTSKKDAQHILRNIDNIDVIPKIIYDENLDLFAEYENEKEKKQKYGLKRKIDKLFISISSKNRYRLNNFITDCPYVKGKYIIDTKYDKEIGLLLEVDEGYSIDSREL